MSGPQSTQVSVRTKAFIISLVVMPVMMGGSLLVQWLLKDYRDNETKKFAVIDRTPNAQLVENVVESWPAE